MSLIWRRIGDPGAGWSRTEESASMPAYIVVAFPVFFPCRIGRRGVGWCGTALDMQAYGHVDMQAFAFIRSTWYKDGGNRECNQAVGQKERSMSCHAMEEK